MNILTDADRTAIEDAIRLAIPARIFDAIEAAVVAKFRPVIERAYLRGFMSSGEGYNGEYPFDDDESAALADTAWVRKRDAVIKELLK